MEAVPVLEDDFVGAGGAGENGSQREEQDGTLDRTHRGNLLEFVSLTVAEYLSIIGLKLNGLLRREQLIICFS